MQNEEEPYKYNSLLILLFEGIGGDTSPYEEHLRATNISTRPEVEVIKPRNKKRAEAYDTLDRIIGKIRENHEQTQMNTVLHCYLSVDPEFTRITVKGEVEVKMECGSWFPIHTSLCGFKHNRQVVWIIFDCDRDHIHDKKYRTQSCASANGDLDWSVDD